MYKGGCLCGALRFHADDDPMDTGYLPLLALSSLGWFDTEDDLPRYAGSEPRADDPGADQPE